MHGPTDLGLSPPGFSSPCTFVAAVSGANGSILWERPAAQDVALVECAIPQPRDSGASSACILMGRLGSFIAVNSFTGRPVLSAVPPGLSWRGGLMPGCSVPSGAVQQNGNEGYRVGGNPHMRTQPLSSYTPKLS